MSLDRTPQIALVGNPNTGKTTLFNALTGLRHKVGNYAGVTVDRKVGTVALGEQKADLIDLPGIYSLAAHSPDEMVAVDMIAWAHEFADHPADLLLVILDASNLRRNLYLYSQILESKRPVVVALTMVDVARKNNITIDIDLLTERLGVPVVPVHAQKSEGIEELKAAVSAQIARIDQEGHEAVLPPEHQVHAQPVLDGLAELGAAFEAAGAPVPPDFVRLRMIFDVDGYLLQLLDDKTAKALRPTLEKIRKDITTQRVLPALEAHARYSWVAELLDGVVTKPDVRVATSSDKIDAIITHKVWGTALFVVIMVTIFQAIFAWAAPAMDLIEGVFGSLGDVVREMMPPGALQSLVADGIIGGVGGVIVFVPQIFILFLFIAILEDCGYLARAAVLMDKVMSKVGLSGTSFIPMLSGFACAIPSIMSARTIADHKDRMATILVIPLMSCSARLPVYILIIAAFVPAVYVAGFINLQSLVLMAMYSLGIIVAVPVAFILKRTVLKGPSPSFVMELPSYKWPAWKTVLATAGGQAKAFLVDAGTVILAVSIVVWALTYFPRSEVRNLEFEEARQEVMVQGFDEEKQAAALVEIDHQEESANINHSYLASMGKTIEPVFAPLGWDWKLSMSVLASFPAREIIVATLGTIYSVGSDADEESQGLRSALQDSRHPDGSKVFTIPVAMSIMVFFALCMQCFATLAIMRRVTGSWKWPAIAFSYMTLLAYIGAFLTTKIGNLLL
ncbi:ferrous iron transport protein B [Bradymonas sediminis]|uniref:Ferrous iron transport protein B n=1 Tax=Bradymonas sediminis TaxID=1548548 RepID=A0A2Z4FJM0_9DELT|nr:ferrous iron transport protein B [Bradymonas sediminis]AWV88898.1 ferrous iron transport protein B [Bradymonas sediminis]TDP71905.1 ferrous iron transport protein B [Bradymonas sediminis]